MRKALIAACLLLPAAACAPLLGAKSSQDCAALVAQQLASSKPVKGSFECFNAEMQNNLHAYAIADDATLAAAIGIDGKVYYAGQTPDGGVYVVDDGQGNVTPYVVHLDKAGKVDKVS